MNRPCLEVSLPEALLNEPFTNTDNGYRVEIIVPRRKFEFKISDVRSTVLIGGERIGSPLCHNTMRPSKRTSHISVLTVYDTYGLAVAKKYIHKCMFLLPEGRDSWMSMYLMGSIVAVSYALGISDSSNLMRGSVTQRCKTLLTLLSEHDKKSLCTSGPITGVHQLPLEVIALITGSLRISKAVSALVLLNRSITLPSEESVIGWSDRDGVSFCESENCYYEQRGDSGFYVLYLRGTHYTLDIGKDVYNTSGSIMPSLKCSSLYSYYKYAVATRCNPLAITSLLLDNLQQGRLTLDQLCSWTVQLSSDTKSNVELKRVAEGELRHHLVHLINLARQIDYSK
ncbi:Hypothetical protein POVR2_LOCUS401 [uncultured virus]|nr:Hypothetical protein POVR2_LOCUS401 [uncultured virus]